MLKKQSLVSLSKDKAKAPLQCIYLKKKNYFLYLDAFCVDGHYKRACVHCDGQVETLTWDKKENLTKKWREIFKKGNHTEKSKEIFTSSRPADEPEIIELGDAVPHQGGVVAQLGAVVVVVARVQSHQGAVLDVTKCNHLWRVILSLGFL